MRNFRRSVSVVSLVIVAVLLGLSPVFLQASTVYYGCLDCIERTVLTYPRDYCQQVGSNENGDGIKCTEVNWGEFQYCSVDGGPCYNVEADPDPGGGGGGGGCTIAPGAWCPPECSSCETDPFKY